MKRINHNELVKYKTSMNKVGFNVLSHREMNVFFAIVSRMRNKGTRKITFSYKYLMELSNLHFQGRPSQFTRILKKTYHKMLKLTIFYENKHIYQAWVLFTTFRINKDKKQVTIAVNPDLLPFLNHLQRWTRFSLKEFTHLKSNYSQTALREIKAWRTVGHVKLSMERFRQIMNIPKSYSNSHITTRVIKPILTELIPIIRGLGIDKIKGKHNKTVGYWFHWTPELHNQDDFSHGAKADYDKMVEYIQNNGVVSDSIKQKALDKVNKRFKYQKRIQFHTTKAEPIRAFNNTLKNAPLDGLKNFYRLYSVSSPLVNFSPKQAKKLLRTIKRKSK